MAFKEVRPANFMLQINTFIPESPILLLYIVYTNNGSPPESLLSKRKRLLDLSWSTSVSVYVEPKIEIKLELNSKPCITAEFTLVSRAIQITAGVELIFAEPTMTF